MVNRHSVVSLKIFCEVLVLSKITPVKSTLLICLKTRFVFFIPGFKDEGIEFKKFIYISIVVIGLRS